MIIGGVVIWQLLVGMLSSFRPSHRKVWHQPHGCRDLGLVQFRLESLVERVCSQSGHTLWSIKNVPLLFFSITLENIDGFS